MNNFNNLTRNQKIFIIIFIILGISVLAYTFWNFYAEDETEYLEEELMVEPTNETNNTNEIVEAPTEKIVVHIMGCVKNPGIVELDVDSRVSDAVEAAGGLTNEANLDKINLAYKLEDGQKISIPSIYDKLEEDSTYEDFITNDSGNIISKSPSNSSSAITDSKININTASQTELETLPGIGSSTASKIITHRNENGKFRKH